jgi:hypothetical protein
MHRHLPGRLGDLMPPDHQRQVWLFLNVPGEFGVGFE